MLQSVTGQRVCIWPTYPQKWMLWITQTILQKIWHQLSTSAAPSPQKNAAKSSIQTWSKHFHTGIATCSPELPATKSDLLMTQCDTTLNILCYFQQQTKLSAYTCLHGRYNFNRSPMAPPGTKVVFHKTLDQRTIWGQHGVQVSYIVPITKH